MNSKYWKKQASCKINLINLSLAGILFSSAFALYWKATGPWLTYDTYWVNIKPYWHILKREWTFEIIHVRPAQAGAEFFLYPVFRLIGWEPINLKIIAVFVFALSLPILYFALIRLYDKYTVTSLMFIFLSLEFLLRFRNSDQHFVY